MVLLAFFALDWSFYLTFFAVVPTLETKKEALLCHVNCNCNSIVSLGIPLIQLIHTYLDEQIETKRLQREKN